MIRLYALRCIACARPWSATLGALRGCAACPFCGAKMPGQVFVPPGTATRAEFVERLIREYMPEALT